jgi:signal transduction histidine kinase
MQVIQHCIDQQKFLSAKKNIQMSFELKNNEQAASSISVSNSANIPIIDHKNILRDILGDKGRYIQILQNFLSNAVKFTINDGSIRVVVTI